MANEEKTMEKTDMSQTMKDQTGDQMPMEQWLAIRKEAGLKIDPETAEVEWTYAYIQDP
jgi:hypothetical protein